MHSQLCSAATALLQDLDVDPDLVPGHRLYRAEILQPHPDVSIILVTLKILSFKGKSKEFRFYQNLKKFVQPQQARVVMESSLKPGEDVIAFPSQSLKWV